MLSDSSSFFREDGARWSARQLPHERAVCACSAHSGTDSIHVLLHSFSMCDSRFFSEWKREKNARPFEPACISFLVCGACVQQKRVCLPGTQSLDPEHLLACPLDSRALLLLPLSVQRISERALFTGHWQITVGRAAARRVCSVRRSLGWRPPPRQPGIYGAGCTRVKETCDGKRRAPTTTLGRTRDCTRQQSTMTRTTPTYL